MHSKLLRLGMIASILLAPCTPALADGLDVPFEPCNGLICLAVTLADGHSHLLLLDTGNVNSWLTVATAQGLKLKLEPIEADGKTLAGVFRLGTQSVSLGRASLTGRFLALAPEQSGELPPKVEGALAYTMFKDRVLQIDYPHRRVRVREPPSEGAAEPGQTMTLITFGKQGPPIVVGSGFTVNGKAVQAQIDTCYTGTLLIYDQAIAGLDLKSGSTKGQARFFPYTDGGVNMNEATVQDVAFGSYVLAAHPATIYFSGEGAAPVHQPDGLFEATVGNALLRHSVLTLDFRSMKVNVQPG